jgi:hypothetical protein
MRRKRFWKKAQKHMRRSFSLFISVASLETNAAKTTILHPIEAENCSIPPEEVSKILDLMEGYPFFLQEWSKQCCEAADQCPSTKGAASYAQIVAVTVGEKRVLHSTAGSS